MTNSTFKQTSGIENITITRNDSGVWFLKVDELEFRSKNFKVIVKFLAALQEMLQEQAF